MDVPRVDPPRVARLVMDRMDFPHERSVEDEAVGQMGRYREAAHTIARTDDRRMFRALAVVLDAVQLAQRSSAGTRRVIA